MSAPKTNRVEQKTKWDARRIVVAVLALAMAVLMLLPLVTNVFLFSHAVTKEDIEALRQQKQSIANQQAEAQKELDALAQQENSAMERLNALEEEIGLLSDQINTTQDIIDEYDVLIAESKDELAQAQADEDLYYQQFLQRVRAMEEEGQVSYWEILFQSSSFSDLLDRFNFVNDVMKYDNDMIDNLEAARLAVDAAEQKLEEEQAEQQEARDQMEAERTELEETAQQEEAVLQEILANEEIYSDQIAALSTREEELMGEITAAEEEYAAEQARLALEAQRRKEEEERRAAEEAARQAAIRQQEEEERRRQEEENQNAQEPEPTQEPAAAEEPTTAEEPSTAQEPTTAEEPATTQEPATVEEPAATKEPDPEPVQPADTGKNPSASFSGATLVNYASRYVGVLPYVWGGTSLETGADCSGFVSAVLRHYGLMSGRLTSGSFRSFGKAVSVKNMQVGDIVCYSGHVGFYAGNGLLLSAIGTGRGIGYMSVYYKPILAVRRV